MVMALIASAAAQTRFITKFTPGETLRYQIEARTTTTGKTTTPIVNPEGGSQASQVVSLLVRLDVLDVRAAAGADSGGVRVRATFEKSSARSDSDALDLEEPSLEESYHRIEGHAVEFTISPAGQLRDFKEIEDLSGGPSAAAPAISWLTGIVAAGELPEGNVSVGKRWKSERPLFGAPLAGLTWRTQSTYVRNEPCRRLDQTNSSAADSHTNADECAVILTHLEISRAGSAHGNATPEDYLRNGLRTSGTWTGSGDSLDSISLASGLLVSSTQTSRQEMDYVIKSASTGSSIYHRGKVQTQTQITLLSDSRLGSGF